MDDKKNNPQSGQKKLIYILAAILLAVLLVAGGYFLAENQRKSGPVTVGGPTEFEFEDEQTREVREAKEQSGIQIPGYTVIPIKANTTDVEIDMVNPEGNNVYFQITMTLKDSGEQLFQSKLIKPGQHLYKQQLSQPLAPGEHTVVIHYDTFSMDGNYTPKNSADLETTLRAE